MRTAPRDGWGESNAFHARPFFLSSRNWPQGAGSSRRFRRGPRLCPPLALSACLILGALAWLLPCGLAAQAVIEFPLGGSNGQPTGITAGPDGNLWFIDWLGHIDRITPGGVVTKFPVPPLVGQASSIATGPDGALWVAEWTKNVIGRMTTAGVWTEFPTPTASSGPETIVAGPDGAMWFTETGPGKIGRMTTSGSCVEYPIPTAFSAPVGLAVGPDGALWFTESGPGKIGRMTTAGVVTAEYPMPPGGDYPRKITAGPDGNLWFTEGPGNSIGRITIAGVITEFALTSTTRVFDIAAGPDGNLWFPEFDANKIGRITPAGEMTEFPIPTPISAAYGIARGPDGNLWFTEFKVNQVGMLRPPAATPGARFYALTPCRLIDTRNASGPDGGPALLAATNRLFRLVGCGVPSTAIAVAANVTVTQGSSSGSLTVYPAGGRVPNTSSINYRAGQTRANNEILAAGVNNSVFVRCTQASGTVQFILDISGYFQ
jgi:streptogramin lyase